jgi:hypothetical protein
VKVGTSTRVVRRSVHDPHRTGRGSSGGAGRWRRSLSGNAQAPGSINAFFRRAKEGGPPGFPRFKSAQGYDSLQWEDRSGWKLKLEERRLRLKGIGEINQLPPAL